MKVTKTKSEIKEKTSAKIDGIGTTDECLTSRSGLHLIVKYLTANGMLEIIANKLSFIKKSAKGFAVIEMVKQILCYFFDGTHLALSQFDNLKKDKGYAASIETTDEDMCSTDQVTRFFSKFSYHTVYIFRKIQHLLFARRLNYRKPKIVEIMIDTMVLNNDDALKRHGVSPTYKNVKGFQPLNFIWENKMIDSILRGGKKHSNSGKAVIRGIENIVRIIREQYSETVPILFLCDSGFFSNDVLKTFERLDVFYIAGAKKYKFVKEILLQEDTLSSGKYKNENQVWHYREFMYKCAAWKQSRRAFFTAPAEEKNKQLILDFSESQQVILTNIPVDIEIEELKPYAHPEKIIMTSHGRGFFELTHRNLKDFGSERLPFKKFNENHAYYYMMVIAHFIFVCYNEDCVAHLVPMIKTTSYAVTIRRTIIDIAGKIVRSGRRTILKFADDTYKNLRLAHVYRLCCFPAFSIA